MYNGLTNHEDTAVSELEANKSMMQEALRARLERDEALTKLRPNHRARAQLAALATKRRAAKPEGRLARVLRQLLDF